MTTTLARSFAIVAAGLTLVAWSNAADTLRLTPDSRLWVDGSSTVRDWSCKAAVVEGAADANAENAVFALLGGVNAVRTATLTIPVAKMDCGNGTMNEHMLKALKAKDNPTITFKVDSYILGKGDSSTTATLVGSLTLGGVTKPITIASVFSGTPNGALRVAGEYELNMKDYDLSPPKLMLGTLKVREKVKVKFDLALR